MKRYTADDFNNLCEDPEGEWVRYKDVKLIIEAKKCKDANRFEQPSESQFER